MDDIDEVLDLVHQSQNLTDRRFQNYDATFHALANYTVLNDRKLSALKTLQTRLLFSVDSIQQSLGENVREFHSFFPTFTLMVSLSDSMVNLSAVDTALVMLKHGHLTFDLLPFPKLNRYTKGLPAKSLLNLVYI